MDRVGIDGLNGPVRKKGGTRSRAKLYKAGSEHVDTMQNSSVSQDLSQGSDEFQKYQLDRVFGNTNNFNRSPSEAQVEAGAIALLKEQGFSTGLAIALNVNAKVFDRRIWIVDNSGSMEIADGHRIVMTSDRKTVAQSVSRWEELQDTVIYHSEMAALLNSPTLFKLLNHPGPGFKKQDFSVATPGSSSDEDIRKARTFMSRLKPIGATPLTSHVWNLQKSIHAMAPKLRREGRRVVVVLATDGLPTDKDGYIGDHVDAEFLSALKSLEGLPIWVVIRLCTDEEKVTKFYNELDGKLDLSLEVLDDFLGEAEEVNRHNKWLNYCLPLHRCRELGYHNRVFDFLDERPLTKDELRHFCSVLFGSALENIPDPTVNWRRFLTYVQEKLGFEDQQYDPLRRKKGPWIYIKHLHRMYGKGKCTIM